MTGDCDVSTDLLRDRDSPRGAHVYPGDAVAVRSETGVRSISAVVAVSPSESQRVYAHVGALTGDCVTRVRASSLLVDADLIADPGESGETVHRASRRVLSDSQ